MRRIRDTLYGWWCYVCLLCWLVYMLTHEKALAAWWADASKSIAKLDTYDNWRAGK